MDLGEAILAPGFVDAHAHLEWSLMDGVLPSEPFAAWLAVCWGCGGGWSRRTTSWPPAWRRCARCGAGTTTLADSGPTGAGVIAMAETGLRGPVHLEAFGREEGARAPRARRRDAPSAWPPSPRRPTAATLVGLSPHAPYTVGPGLWAALRAAAGARARPWATHIAESDEERRVIAGGAGALTEVFSAAGFVPGRWRGRRGGTGSCARMAGAGRAARAGLVAAHCVRLGPGDRGGAGERGRRRGPLPALERAPALRPGAPSALREAAGAALGLGTDSPASGGDYDLRAEARACARHPRRRPRPRRGRAAAAGTIGGAAAALGMDDEVGEPRPGQAGRPRGLDAPPRPGADP